jgi:protein TonB
MLISNFNLCKDEWLELVFANRNKEYGAFYIRQHSAQNIVKAMVITFVSAVSLTFVVGILIAAKPIAEKWTEVDNKTYVIPPVPPKADRPKPKPTEAQADAPKAATQVNVTRSSPPIVTPDPQADDLPKIEDGAAAGPVTITGGEKGNNAEGGIGTGKGGEGVGSGDVEDTKTYIFAEKMPEPANGMNGWMKFLQGNIKYPALASENGISGKVLVSFIIEKDGHLSNIKVERGQGYGLDEEAIRVLKLAKAWTPGMQNGRPIRVKLTLPISFALGE